jgi:hypothetical protein
MEIMIKTYFDVVRPKGDEEINRFFENLFEEKIEIQITSHLEYF